MLIIEVKEEYSEEDPTKVIGTIYSAGDVEISIPAADQPGPGIEVFVGFEAIPLSDLEPALPALVALLKDKRFKEAKRLYTHNGH